MLSAYHVKLTAGWYREVVGQSISCSSPSLVALSPQTLLNAKANIMDEGYPKKSSSEGIYPRRRRTTKEEDRGASKEDGRGVGGGQAGGGGGGQ